MWSSGSLSHKESYFLLVVEFRVTFLDPKVLGNKLLSILWMVPGHFNVRKPMHGTVVQFPKCSQSPRLQQHKFYSSSFGHCSALQQFPVATQRKHDNDRLKSDHFDKELLNFDPTVPGKLYVLVVATPSSIETFLRGKSLQWSRLMFHCNGSPSNSSKILMHPEFAPVMTVMPSDTVVVITFLKYVSYSIE